jgi:hypothetical protein
LINIATTNMAIDPDKDDDSRAYDLSCSLGEQRGPSDPSFPFQSAQLGDVAALLRTILVETRQTSQRLSSIEQILENLKAGADCMEEMHASAPHHPENKDMCG